MSITMKIAAVIILVTLIFFYFVHASGTVKMVETSKRGIATEYEGSRVEWHWERFFPYFQTKAELVWVKAKRSLSRFKKKMSNL